MVAGVPPMQNKGREFSNQVVGSAPNVDMALRRDGNVPRRSRLMATHDIVIIYASLSIWREICTFDCLFKVEMVQDYCSPEVDE